MSTKAEAKAAYDHATATCNVWKERNPGVDINDNEVGARLAKERDDAQMKLDSFK